MGSQERAHGPRLKKGLALGARSVALVALVAATLVVAPVGPADAATFDVTRFDDPVPDGCNSGTDCSLREAVIDANATGGADVIDLPSGAYFLTLPGSLENSAATGDLDISDDVTINGAPPSVSVQTLGFGGDPDRVFHTRNDAVVALSGMEIRNGQAPTAEPYGGGILQENGSLILTQVRVAENTNPGPAGSNDADGGGIATFSGSLILSGSSVQENSTNDDGGGIAMIGGDLTLDNASIDQNTATGPGSGGSSSSDGSNGGGLFLGIGATGDLTDSGFSSNSAPDGDEYSGGGGLFIAGAATATNLTATDNTATFGGAGRIAPTGSLTANALAATRNHADGTGGGLAVAGVLDVTGGDISSNTANMAAGGLSVGSNDGPVGDVSLTGIAIQDNGAPTAGGIFTFSGSNFSTNSGDIARNAATAGPGGGLRIFGTATLSDTTVLDNSATESGGGIRIENGAALSASNMTVTRSTAGFGGGGLAVLGTLDATEGEIGANSSGQAGGGLYVSPSGSASLAGVKIDDNDAVSNGGGIFVFAGGTLALERSSVNGNAAAGGEGGGIANGGTAMIANTDVSSNSVPGSGGGILNAGSLAASVLTVRGNDARTPDTGLSFGGGILSAGTTSLESVLIEGNLAETAGAGVAVPDGSLTATDLAVLDNGGDPIMGGGIAVFAGGLAPPEIDLERGIIAGHSVTGAGAGALVSAGGTNSLTNVTVSENTVAGSGIDGGGIRVQDAGTTLELEYSTVVDNTAPSGGGIAASANADVQALASLITDNSGADCATSNGATLGSNDFNVVGDSTCGFGQPNDLNDQGPMLGTTLGPLADNGGWDGVMLTHALLPGNSAINHADSPMCPPSDERGVARPFDTACDTGAYEANDPPVDPNDEVTIDKVLVGEAVEGGEARWRITMSNVGTDPAPGRLTFADTLPDTVRYTSAVADDWDCSVDGQTVTCFYNDDLDPGVVTDIEIVAAVEAEAGADITNTASVSTFGSVDPIFDTAPGEVTESAKPDNPDSPQTPDPSGDPTGGGSAGTGEPTGTLPFTGFHLAEIALAAAAAVAFGAMLTWRNRRRARA